MAILALKILQKRPSAAGTYRIYVSLTFKRDIRYIATEFEVNDVSEFEDGRVCYRKDAATMNKRLSYVLSGYQERLKMLDTREFINCSQLKEALVQPSKRLDPLSITELFDRRILRLENEGRHSSAKIIKYTQSVVLGILPDKPINTITRQDIKKLDRVLKSRYSPENVNIRLKDFKATINEAIFDNLVKYEEHPFKGLRIQTAPPRQMDITLSEFKRIRDLSPDSKRLELAQKIFLLSFYLGGINLADLVRADLRGPILRYDRKKTEGRKNGESTTLLTIPGEARVLIEWFERMNILKVNTEKEYQNLRRHINKCLDMLAEKAGIKTTFPYYSARKTFAQFAFEIGTPIEVIEYCLGQIMKMNRPVFSYVRVMQRQADKAIRNVIDYTNNPNKYLTCCQRLADS